MYKARCFVDGILVCDGPVANGDFRDTALVVIFVFLASLLYNLGAAFIFKNNDFFLARLAAGSDMGYVAVVGIGGDAAGNALVVIVAQYL